MKMPNRALVAAAVLAACGTSAQAATFEFGELLSGSYEPSDIFATLSINQLSGTTFNYSLSTNDLNSLFTAGAFVGSMTNDVLGYSALPTVSNISGGGVAVVEAENGGGPGGNWEFRYDFGDGSGDRLFGNETVSWTATFSDSVTYTGDGFALHVQGLTSLQGGSAWYTPTTPIPEPETYAMMLAGLGLLGFVARRRMKGAKRA